MKRIFLCVLFFFILFSSVSAASADGSISLFPVFISEVSVVRQAVEKDQVSDSQSEDLLFALLAGDAGGENPALEKFNQAAGEISQNIAAPDSLVNTYSGDLGYDANWANQAGGSADAWGLVR